MSKRKATSKEESVKKNPREWLLTDLADMADVLKCRVQFQFIPAEPKGYVTIGGKPDEAQ